MLELPDFQRHAPVAAETVDAYRDLVPVEVVELWQHYGYGTFGDGFLRVIDPQAYEARIGNLLGKMIGEGEALPIMVTALADVVLWEPDRGVAGLLLRQRRAVGLGSRPRALLELTAKHGAKHLARAFDWAPYPEAVARHGVPGYEQALVRLPQRADEPAPALDALELHPALPAVEALLERQGPILH